MPLHFNHFSNPWAAGGSLAGEQPWTQAGQGHGWDYGNDYFQPKTKEEIRKEGLLQLALAAVIVAAPVVAGAMAGGAAAGMGASAQAAGAAVGQGVAGGAAAGLSAGSAAAIGGALAYSALQPFLPSSSNALPTPSGSLDALDRHFQSSQPTFPTPTFPWLPKALHPATQLLKAVAERIEKAPSLANAIQHAESSGRGKQQVASLVSESLSALSAPASPALSPPTSGTKIIPDSWWKDGHFGHGFVAGFVNGLGGIGVSVWEMMQLSYGTPFPYYDWIFEGGDTHRGTWEKAKLLGELAVDADLRERAAENIAELWEEFWGDLGFENGSAEAGYQYGALLPDVLLVLLSDGGWTAKRVLDALRNGGRELRKLFVEAFSFEGRGLRPLLDDLEDVLLYVRQLPAHFSDSFIKHFGKGPFSLKINDVIRYSSAEFMDVKNNIARYAVWMVQVHPEFRRTGEFTKWVNSLALRARVEGLGSLELTFLNVGAPGFQTYLSSWGEIGWKVEIISADGISPTIRLTKVISQ